MTADDLRALATAAHLHDLSYAMLVDWLVDHVDALADLIEVVWTLMEWADNYEGTDIDAVRDALAALDQEAPT